MIKNNYQQNLEKTDHFDAEMYRNGKVTELKFYNVSTSVSIQKKSWFTHFHKCDLHEQAVKSS